jgi:1-acyl-sn-glycerol-3-phosphate acyltransferase
LDILVLGAVFPGTFVSKADVAKWPGIGLLATIARTIYIDRRRESAANHANMMDERMREGEPLLFFPEGTSSDGNRVLPFKSALFKTAESMIDDKPVHVQPVSIAYTKVDGMPVGYVWRPMYAWYGDMDLASHFWQVLMMGKATVEVEFHGTRLLNHDIPASRARKELSKACEDDIRGGVERALTGRHPDQQNPLEDSETRSKQAADDFDDDLDWDDDMQDDAYASAAGAPTRPDTATDK